jgi:hypothetical protein
MMMRAEIRAAACGKASQPTERNVEVPSPDFRISANYRYAPY